MIAPLSGIVVGIDQSYDGFAMVTLDRHGNYDEALGHFKAEKYGRGVQRLFAIESWVFDQLLNVQHGNPGAIVHVCMEGYAPGAKFQREQLGELGAAVKYALFNALPYPVGHPTIVSPGQLKKFATGKGVAAKDIVIKEVFKKWGADFNDNNLADAFVLAKIAFALHSNSDDLLAYEREVLANLTRHTEQWPRPEAQTAKTRRTS